MAHPTLYGIVPPIITPMNADESVNIPELRNQIERQIAGGVHGIFCFGTNGEGYILSLKEKEEILEATVDHSLRLLCVQVFVFTVDQLTESLFLGFQRVGRGFHVLYLLSPGVRLFLLYLAFRLLAVLYVVQRARFALAGVTSACLCLALCGGGCRPIAALKQTEGHVVKVHIVPP